MTRSLASFLAIALFAFFGCEKNPPGGPGATNTGNKPIVGQAEDTFTLSGPGSTKLKQGEKKDGTISIKRGKNFGEDVAIKFTDVPKGVTIEPASPVISHADTETKIAIMATDDAAVGDFTVKVTGHPPKGNDYNTDFKLTVEKK